MAKSIEIQLTSRSADGQWSWRAAGAREPRGTLATSLVPAEAKEGDVLKAEYERSIEGIEIVAIQAPTAPKERISRGETIELLGSGRTTEGISWSLAPKAKGRGRRDDQRGERAGQGDRRGGDRRPGGRGRAGEPRGPRATGRLQGPPMSTEHRNALLATLEPAQLSVAEQLLRGGLPAVRQAIAEQNAAARTSGQPAVSEEAILAMAEKLLPQTSLATWKDRAHAAQVGGKETRLRDLRAVVTASRSVSLDDEGRAMAKALSDSLQERLTGLSDEWVGRINAALAEDRIADALKLAARSPEPSTRLPADLATTLARRASEALSADADPRTWLGILEAVVDSPVRRTVKPEGIPAEADVEAAARQAAGHVPALAPMLGMRIPPPPPTRRVVHRS
jgi:hypothetical protein